MSLSTADSAAGRRTVAAEDVFFSTTDPKGVITHANATFLRLAALDEATAVGSAHNLIRHPDMPGGLFATVWDELEAGHPVCAYMANQAADGLRYDVLATITPIDGGYLSVRLRPGVEELQREVLDIYDGVAARERALREAGDGRRDAAQRGAAALADELAARGLGTFAELTSRILPREIEALLRDLPPVPETVTRSGPLAVVLLAAQRTVALVEPFAAHLDSFEQLAQAVAAERASVVPAEAQLAGLRDDLAAAAAAVRARGEVDASVSPAVELLDLTDRMVGWTQDALDGLTSLPAHLLALQESLRRLALRISMLVLLAHMVQRFTVEVVEADEQRGTELRVLGAALQQGLDRVEVEIDAVTAQLREIPQLVEAAVRSTDKVTLRIDTWYGHVGAVVATGPDGAAGPGDQLTSLRDSVRARLRDRLRALTPIVGLSTRLRQTPMRFATEAVRAELEQIAAGVAHLP